MIFDWKVHSKCLLHKRVMTLGLNVVPSGNIPVAQRNSNISLYDHQKAAYQKLSDWDRTAKGDPAGLLVLPTGGGKTLTATYWLMQNVLSKGKKVLWIAHRYSLLEQAYHAFEMICCRDISSGGKSSYSYRIISGIHESAKSIRLDDDILIASKASLSVKKAAFRTWLEKNRDNFYFIIDEAHHVPAKGYRDLIRDMRQYGGKFFMLGLTATPFRTFEEEKGWMKKVFPDDILYRISISDLISRQILSKPIFERIDTDIDMREFFEKHDAEAIYKRIIRESSFDLDGAGKDAKLAAELIAENNQRNMSIVEAYKKDSSKYGKTLVFALNRAMAKLLYKYFKDANIRVGFVISGREDGQDNEAIIKDFKADKLDVLINVNIVTEGVDVPNVKTVFLTRPTKSKILMTQMIGRGLRGQKVGGTEITYVVDFLDKWQDDLVAWVIPEKLYDGETLEIQFPKGKSSEEELTEWEILHTISEGKLAEFIRLANSKFDLSLFEKFSMIERVPLGYYYFDYEVTGEDGEGSTKFCTVMVYDCMKAKFDELIDWLNNRPDKKFFDIEAMADEIDEKFFGEREELLGYSKENICDILRFYAQNEGESPQFVEFAKRAEYDVSILAQHLTDANYIEDEWNRPDGKWKNFFGEQNKTAFITAITAEALKNAGLLKKPTNALTNEEIQTAENLPLNVLVTRQPGIYEKIRDTVYESARVNGEYVDSQSSRRSKSRLDFEIGYKTPLSAGGKTKPDNLQLVHIGDSITLKNWEDLPLSDIEHKDPVQYKRICDAVYRYYQFRNGDYYDEENGHRSDNRLDFKVDYIIPLSKGGKTTIENLHLVYKDSSTVVNPPPPPPINPVVKPSGESISYQDLTWGLDNAGTLTISGMGCMKNYSSAEELPWYAQRDSIKKIVINAGVKGIGDYAFYECKSLISVELPDSLNSIGKYAFYHCENLKAVDIPDNVTFIGEDAFCGCSKLVSLNIPESVKVIQGYAFAFCAELRAVKFLCNLTEIPNGLFNSCKNLTDINIPRTVERIEQYAFRSCSSLTSVRLPENINFIGAGIFRGCKNLESIHYKRGLNSNFIDKLRDGNSARRNSY